jgi:TolB-like protein/Flp pilus assembly protein TadD
LSLEADESLSIGLTDALITRLGNIRGLAVRPTSAVLPFAASDETPQAIGGKLNVETILESSMQRTGNRLRVSVQLVKTADGAILWSENFDEADADLFKIQDSISARVADAFRLKNTDEQTASRRTDDTEAYKLYLRGRHAWNKRTPEALQQSIQFFQQSIDRDPTFALSFAGLADSYALLGEYNVAPPRDSFPQAKAAAQKALDIDAGLAEAHTTLAYALASYDWNFAEAEREYRRAIELNPNYATAHQWFGEMLFGLKRFDESEREIARAVELDPLSPIIQADLGLLLHYRRDYDAARTQYQKIIRNYPDFSIVYLELTLVNEQQGKYDEAVDSTVEFLRLSGLDENSRSALRGIYQKQGYPGFLQTQIAGANAEAQKHYVPAFAQAFLYARLGDRENTLLWLEKSFNERHRYMAFIAAAPEFDFLQKDVRFQNLLKRIGL